jgi:hypothetical protein
MQHTTEGKVTKLLDFKLRYLNRDRSENAMGSVVSRLLLNASLTAGKES